MRKFIVLLLILFSSYSLACFNDDTYKAIVEELPANGNYYNERPYGIIRNIVDCNSYSALSDLVCHDKKMKDALLVLAKGEIHAYENATKSPVSNYSSYNNDLINWMNEIIKSQSTKEIAFRKICYIVKNKLSDDFGGDFYYEPIIHEVLSSKLNKNGVIVESLSSIFYLGKSCDATNSAKSKGKWYINRDKDQFIIELNNATYRFNHDDNVFLFNCEKQ